MAAGTYDLTQISLTAYDFDPFVPLTLELRDGAVFSVAPPRVSQGLRLLSKSHQPIVTAAQPASHITLLEEGSAFETDASATAPFVHVLAGGQFAVVLNLGGQMHAAGPGQPVFEIDAAGFAFAIAGEGASVDDYAFSGAGNGVVSVISTSASVSQTQGMVPSSNFQVNLQTQALLEAIDPDFGSGSSLLWNQPTWPPFGPNVQAALRNLLRRSLTYLLAPGQPPDAARFADLASLCAAANQAAPGRRIVLCDFSGVGGTYSVPPGNYDMGGEALMTVTRAWGTGSTTLDLQDGVHLFGFYDWLDLTVRGNASGPGAAPLQNPPGVTAQYSFGGAAGCGLVSAGPGPVILTQGQARVVLRGRVTVQNVGPFPVLSTDATLGSALDVEAYDLVAIGSNTLSYDPASAGTVYVSDGATVDFVQFVPGGRLLAGAVPQYVIEGSFVTAPTGPGPVYTIKHSLGTIAPVVTVYDGTGLLISPLATQVVDENNVDLTLGPGFVGTVGVRR